MAQQAGAPAKRASLSVERAQAEADIWNSKGNAYLSLKDYGTAIRCFNLALQTLPGSEKEDVYLSNRATALFRIGEFQKAVEGFKRASELRPTNHSHLTCLGKVYLRWGGHEAQALEALHRSLLIERTTAASNLANKAKVALDRVEQETDPRDQQRSTSMGAGASSHAARKQASSTRGRPWGRPARESEATADETRGPAPSQAHEKAPAVTVCGSRGQADETDVDDEARLEAVAPKQAPSEKSEQPVSPNGGCVGGEEKEAMLESMEEVRTDEGAGAGGRGHESDASAPASTSGRNLARRFWRGGSRGLSRAGSSRRFLRSASGTAPTAGVSSGPAAKGEPLISSRRRPFRRQGSAPAAGYTSRGGVNGTYDGQSRSADATAAHAGGKSPRSPRRPASLDRSPVGSTLTLFRTLQPGREPRSASRRRPLRRQGSAPDSGCVTSGDERKLSFRPFRGIGSGSRDGRRARALSEKERSDAVAHSSSKSTGGLSLSERVRGAGMSIFGDVEAPSSERGDGGGRDGREAVPDDNVSEREAEGGVGQGGQVRWIGVDESARDDGEAPRDGNHAAIPNPELREEVAVGGCSEKCRSDDEDAGDTAGEARLGDQGMGFATPESEGVAGLTGGVGEEHNGRIVVEAGCVQGTEDVVSGAQEDRERTSSDEHHGGGATGGVGASGANTSPKSSSNVEPASKDSDTCKEVESPAERTTGLEDTGSLDENEPPRATETATSLEEADEKLALPQASEDSAVLPEASPPASTAISSTEDTKATTRTQPTCGGRGLAPLKIPPFPEACDSRVPRMKEAEYSQRRAAGMPRSRSRRLRSRGRGLRMERPPGKAPEESPPDFLEILGLMKNPDGTWTRNRRSSLKKRATSPSGDDDEGSARDAPNGGVPPATLQTFLSRWDLFGDASAPWRSFHSTGSARGAAQRRGANRGYPGKSPGMGNAARPASDKLHARPARDRRLVAGTTAAACAPQSIMRSMSAADIKLSGAARAALGPSIGGSSTPRGLHAEAGNPRSPRLVLVSPARARATAADMVRLVRVRSSPRLCSPRHTPGTSGWSRMTAGDSWGEEDKVFISVLEAVGRAAQRPGVRTLVGGAPASAPKRVNTTVCVDRAGHGAARLLSVKRGEAWTSSIAPSSAPERRGTMAGTLSRAAVGSGDASREEPTNPGATGGGGASDDEDLADDVPPPDFWPLPREGPRERDAKAAATAAVRAAAISDGHAPPADLTLTPGAASPPQGRSTSSTGGPTQRYSPAVSSRAYSPTRTGGGALACRGDHGQDARDGVVTKGRRRAEENKEEVSTQAREGPGTEVSPGRAAPRQDGRAEGERENDSEVEEEDKVRNGKVNPKKGRRPEYEREPPCGGVPGACEGQPPGRQGDGLGHGSVGIGGGDGARGNSGISRIAHDAGARGTSAPSSEGASSKKGDDYRRDPTGGGDNAPTEGVGGPELPESDRTRLPWAAATTPPAASATSSAPPRAENLLASRGPHGFDGLLVGVYRAAAVGVLGNGFNSHRMTPPSSTFRTSSERAPGAYSRSWDMSWRHRRRRVATGSCLASPRRTSTRVPGTSDRAPHGVACAELWDDETEGTVHGAKSARVVRARAMRGFPSVCQDTRRRRAMRHKPRASQTCLHLPEVKPSRRAWTRDGEPVLPDKELFREACPSSAAPIAPSQAPGIGGGCTRPLRWANKRGSRRGHTAAARGNPRVLIRRKGKRRSPGVVNSVTKGLGISTREMPRPQAPAESSLPGPRSFAVPAGAGQGETISNSIQVSGAGVVTPEDQQPDQAGAATENADGCGAETLHGERQREAGGRSIECWARAQGSDTGPGVETRDDKREGGGEGTRRGKGEEGAVHDGRC